ncbi:MAG: sensor histidine kinase N-terminal domain-containing protein [Gammaproteobacteria bacterium]|nr:sensor histidine kinase N-terminal domain-containing protein [Gammaproteobacteria bacterium]
MSARSSLRLRLIAMLLSAVLVVWLAVAVLVYFAAGHEVEEVFDANLAQSAHILRALVLHEIEEEGEMAAKVREVVAELGQQGAAAYPRLSALLQEYLAQGGKEQISLVDAVEDVGHRYVSGSVFIVRHRDGSIMMRGGAAPDIPLLEDGYLDVEHNGENWRVFQLTGSNSGLTVQVGERREMRLELVGYITRNTLMPLILALPLIGILIWVIVGKALASLQRVATSVSRRSPEALEPIDERDSPREIESLLSALNSLFERVAAAITRERDFTADAAHELRTPLAALKTHLQVARSQSSERTTQRSLDQALEGVDRATHSVEQMLALARADAMAKERVLKTKVDLRDLAIEVVSLFSQQAVDRQIDLGVEAPAGVQLLGDAAGLQMLLRNLVDNALRYTNPGGEVTIMVIGDAGGARLEVVDSGIGVAPAEREKIFRRFHRSPDVQASSVKGSGLGLSIVQRIADLHGAGITVGDGLDGRGLRIRIDFPGVG